MKKIYMLVLLLSSYTMLNAQVLEWDFQGNNGSENTVLPTSADPNVAPTTISRGNLSSLSLDNSFNSEGWSTSPDLAGAIASQSYYEFSIEAVAGYTVSLAGINTNFRRAGSGPRLFQWMYSLDGFNFSTIGGPVTYFNTTTNGTAQPPIDLSTNPELTNVPAGTTITIRLYGYNASNTNGSFGLGRLFGNDLSITGTVTTVIPIRLISFGAVNNKNVTKLNWRVNCTSTSANFQVLRGKSLTDMTPIYTATESNARCAMPFDLVDPSTPEGVNFYRLKMTDIDGKSSYSHVLQVVNKTSPSISVTVLPTIVMESATLSIPSGVSGIATINLIDGFGRISRRIQAGVTSGTNNVSLNTSDLVAGMYYIRVVLPDGTEGKTTMIKK